MTLIENDSPKVQYTGPFIKGQLLPLTFPYIATEDVKMIIDDTPAIFNVDYEIITEPNDEHPVAYPNSAYIKNDLPNATQITIYRSTPLDQQAPFPQMSKFRSERIEQALDKLTMQQQEQVEQLSRCIIAPITLETFNGQLPAPAADQALKWNSEGTELENYDIIGEQEAFETEVNTKFEEQSTAFENRIGQFEEETNTQFSDFRNEINENLEAVLNAADKLDTLEQQVQAATNAANTAITSAARADEYAEEASMSVTKADEYAEEASMSAAKAEDTLEEIKQVIQDAEIDIGAVTDALNNKVDLDGGNYPGSGLEAIIGKNEGGTGLQLFDTIIKDHVLTYEESKGLALQGTYVYKEALAGSRYGYPDFYNKCLEEYNDSSNNKQYLKSNITQVGTLTDNQGVLSGFTPSIYAKVDKAIDFNNADSWEINLKLRTGSNYEAFNDFFGISDFGMALGISPERKFSLAIGTGGLDWSIGSPIGIHTVQDNTDYYVRVRFTGSMYTLEYSLNGEDYSTEATIQSSVKTVSGTPNLGIYNNGAANFTGSIDLNESFININDRRVWNGTETVVKHSNGHVFYDISLKDQIDELFNSTGLAWFYGVDIENERVFLPRQNLLNITDKSILPVAGNGMTLGLNDVTNGNAGLRMLNGYFCPHADAYGSPAGTRITTSGGFSEGYTFEVTQDSSKSGIESHLTDFKEENKYLYICVGNTTNYEGITNVVDQGMDILEQVNQGIESRVKLDGSNAEFPYIVETYNNGTSWYRIWSDGFCIQCGEGSGADTSTTINLLKTHSNADYTILTSIKTQSTSSGGNPILEIYPNRTASSFNLYCTSKWTYYTWQTAGYLAEGQY